MASNEHTSLISHSESSQMANRVSRIEIMLAKLTEQLYMKDNEPRENGHNNITSSGASRVAKKISPCQEVANDFELIARGLVSCLAQNNYMIDNELISLDNVHLIINKMPKLARQYICSQCSTSMSGIAAYESHLLGADHARRAGK